MLFHFCFSHLSLAVTLVFFGVLNFHSTVLGGVSGGGEGALVVVRRNKNVMKYIRCHKISFNIKLNKKTCVCGIQDVGSVL